MQSPSVPNPTSTLQAPIRAHTNPSSADAAAAASVTGTERLSDAAILDWLEANASTIHMRRNIGTVSVITKMRRADFNTVKVHIGHNLRAAVCSAINEEK